jgi:hypothetical protein
MRATLLFLYAALGLLSASAAQFVEISALVETIDWRYQEETGLPLKNIRTHTLRCVVGKDQWLMENLSRSNVTESTWFLNGMIVRQVSYHSTDDSSSDGTGYRSSRRTARNVGMMPSPEGYPGGDALANATWFAFCSGSFLQKTTRGVPLPTAGVNETVFGFTNEMRAFTDELGLPRTASFYAPPRELKCRYEVAQSTNVLGWNFPLVFAAEQREPDRFGKWNRNLTINGRVTTIRSVPKLEVPEEILERLQSPDTTTIRRRP